MKGRSCPVREYATDQVLHTKVKAFQTYKILQQVNAPEKLTYEQLVFAGLHDDANNLIRAENVYAKARLIELEKQKKHGR